MQDEFYVQAMLLAKVVRRVLEKKAGIKFSEDPEFTLKPMVSFRNRMRIGTLEKFDVKTYIGTINFYENDEAMGEHNALGIILVYLPEDYIDELFRKLPYGVNLDEDDEAMCQDACGTFANLIGGNFKSGMHQLGYQELTMSSFSTYVNEAVDGVEAYLESPNYYEISFKVRGRKRLVVDYNMGLVPKK